MKEGVNPYESPELIPESPKKAAPPEASPRTRIVTISVALCLLYNTRSFWSAAPGEPFSLLSSFADWPSLVSRATFGALQGLGLAALVLAGSKRQLHSLPAFRRWIRRLSPGDWLAIHAVVPLFCSIIQLIWQARPDPEVGKAIDHRLDLLLYFGLLGWFLTLALSWTREPLLWRIVCGVVLASACIDLLKIPLAHWAPPEGWFEPWYWTWTYRLASGLTLAQYALITAGMVVDLQTGRVRGNLHWAALTLFLVRPLIRILGGLAGYFVI